MEELTGQIEAVVTQRSAPARRHCLPRDGGTERGGEVIRAGGYSPTMEARARGPLWVGGGSWRKRGASLAAIGGVCDWDRGEEVLRLLPFPDFQSLTSARPWSNPAGGQLAKRLRNEACRG